MKWWRRQPKIEVASLDQLTRRISQLERAVGDGGSRVLHRVVEDYQPFAHPGVLRDAYDNVVGEWTPEIPEHIQRSLDRAKNWGDAPYATASGVSWRDVLTPRRVLAADGTQISNTTTETIMCPDFTFAADYFEVGDAFKYTLLFDHSTVITTPGTHTYRLRYGGVGGTSMAASGAFAPDPTAASTTVSEMLEYWFVCRSTGSSGSFFTMGRYTPNDFDDASVSTIVGNLNMLMIPTSAPAAVSSLDTTAAKAISPTYTSSVNTATTQVTNHIAILESLN